MQINQIKTKNEWHRDFDIYMNNRFEKIECEHCGGEKIVECGCNCPSCELEVDCDHCGGEGFLYESESIITKKPMNWAANTISDVRKMCVWTGKDFLVEVGPLIKYFRSEREEIGPMNLPKIRYLHEY